MNQKKLNEAWEKEREILKLTISKNKFKLDNELAARQRTFQRRNLIRQNAIPKFDKKDTENIINVRYNSIYHNISQFGFFLEKYYLNSNLFKKILVHYVLGEKRFYAIIISAREKNEKDYVTINEVFSLFKWLNLKKDFMNYIQSKTQFTYSVTASNEIKAITNKLFFVGELNQALKIKFAQFVYMILSEYILLHNLMFVSGYKIKEIRTVDKWMENIIKL